MEIRYLGNSGFALTHAGRLAVIDCHNANRVEGVMKPLVQAAEAVVCLASHVHFDHYDSNIRKWRSWGNVSYVLSFDIPSFPGARSISPGQTINEQNIKITAFGSTDAGVSFHMDWDGISLFHAGDLNNWHWSEESTAQEIQAAERDFLDVLQQIKKRVERIDIAMFPVARAWERTITEVRYSLRSL